MQLLVIVIESTVRYINRAGKPQNDWYVDRAAAQSDCVPRINTPPYEQLPREHLVRTAPVPRNVRLRGAATCQWGSYGSNRCACKPKRPYPVLAPMERALSYNNRSPLEAVSVPTIQKLLFIDTNIWLDFYRAQSDAGLKLLNHVEAIKSKIIVTFQLELEFKANRQKVLMGSMSELKAPSGIGLPKIIADAQKTKMLAKDIKDAQRRVVGLKKDLVRVISKPTIYDPVYKVCQRIFRRPGDPLVLGRDNGLKRQIRQKALRRFLHGCPPRKSQDVSIGDAINWEWMLRCAIDQKAELVIVTRDTDYGAIIEGESYINDHLKQEFHERVNKQRKLVLTSRLTEALKHFKIRVTPREVQAEADVMRACEDDGDSARSSETLFSSLTASFERGANKALRSKSTSRKRATEPGPSLSQSSGPGTLGDVVVPEEEVIH